jgi:hypothetical protein
MNTFPMVYGFVKVLGKQWYLKMWSNINTKSLNSHNLIILV